MSQTETRIDLPNGCYWEAESENAGYVYDASGQCVMDIIGKSEIASLAAAMNAGQVAPVRSVNYTNQQLADVVELAWRRPQPEFLPDLTEPLKVAANVLRGKQAAQPPEVDKLVAALEKYNKAKAIMDASKIGLATKEITQQQYMACGLQSDRAWGEVLEALAAYRQGRA